jgi:hypothetical protein
MSRRSNVAEKARTSPERFLQPRPNAPSGRVRPYVPGCASLEQARIPAGSGKDGTGGGGTEESAQRRVPTPVPTDEDEDEITYD